VYGPGDNFDPESSHVLAALVRKFHDAMVQTRPEVVVWGSGRPKRELLFVDDLADACVFLMDSYNDEQTINVGTGADVSIAELADQVRAVVYPSARIVFDRTKPDGPPRKLLDVSRLHTAGWKHRISLEEGIRRTYEWYRTHEAPFV
jgi:GDP-L-fucose synthase